MRYAASGNAFLSIPGPTMQVKTPVYHQTASREPAPPRDRIRLLPVRALVAGVLGVIVLIWLVGAVVSAYLGVYRESLKGQRDLQASMDAVGRLTPGRETALLEGAARRAASANRHFLAANDHLGRNPLFSAAARTPLNPQVQGMRGLNAMGAHAALALETGTEAGASFFRTEGSAAKEPGPRLVKALEEGGPAINRIAAEIGAMQAERARLDPRSLWPPLRAPLAQADAAIAKSAPLVTDYPFWRDAILGLLGADRPRTYLVVNQDSAELRATGGFIGSIGFLKINRGQLGEFELRDVYSFEDYYQRINRGNPKYVEPPAALKELISIHTWTLRDGNWSPDFPTTAEQIRFFLKHELNMTVDGVIAIDPYLLERLLTLTGPIHVDQINETFDAQNFFSKALHRAEFGAGDTAKRKDFLGLLGVEVQKRITGFTPKQWPKVADVLRAACDARDIQAQLDPPAAQALIARFNCTGALRVTPTDYLLSVDSNLGGWKNNFWLERSFKLDLEAQSNGAVRHTLTIHYFNGTPRDHPTSPSYKNYLRLYLPASSRVVSVAGDGLTNLDPLRRADRGYAQLAGWMNIKPGAPWTVLVVYDVPDMVRAQGYELLWQKQAGTRGDDVEVRFATAGASAPAKPPRTWKTRLDRDLTFDVRY
jgi:hypothetical protein